jgi:hypothetical protein
MSVAPFNLRFDTSSTGRRMTRNSTINFTYSINNNVLTIEWTGPIGEIIRRRYTVNDSFTQLVTLDHTPVDILDKQP